MSALYSEFGGEKKKEKKKYFLLRQLILSDELAVSGFLPWDM